MKNSKELTKLVLETTRYSGDHAFFVRKFRKMKKIVKIWLLFGGNSGNSGGDGGGGRCILITGKRGGEKRPGTSEIWFLVFPLASLSGMRKS